MGNTWLEKLEEQLNIDVDWMDPAFSKGLPIVPNDMTSNQLWVDIQMDHPDNVEMVRTAVQEYKNEGWLAVYTRVSVLLTRANIDNIKGRVLLQTLPSEAYNTDGTLAHGRLYAREFAKVGISTDRYCLKIPSTGPGLVAARILESEGVRTLGTALFGLPQAIACSQAGCWAISPYYNGRILTAPLADPAAEHPMSPRLVQILDIYKRLYVQTGKEQPLMKLASFRTAQEVMAAAEFGCHSATVSKELLEKLAQMPYNASDAAGQGPPKVAHVYRDSGPLPARLQNLLLLAPTELLNLDYLANNGSQLQLCIAADPLAQERLNDALDLFKGAEARSRVKIEALMARA
ncbi:hypothetical protein TCE0_060r19032 [Talaromyces pinophilus]|uniref:Aldolase n=1 Tax=Talaromyces pinophilus TaxID=128442 RepID=A0A6V8HPA4_TALPI|nr:hypothetical protein TCE0_060r19032 [Talaromyces pinophilus]